LHKQDVKSGEELEETLIQANAKLYQLVDMKTGWKERGQYVSCWLYICNLLMRKIKICFL